MTLTLDTAWAAGLLLSMIRVAGFVVATPLFPRTIPMLARGGVVVAIGLFLAEPLPGATLEILLSAAVTNVAIGVTLGFLTGLIIHLFSVAGGVVDMTAGLAAGALIDPTMGAQSAAFARMFSMVGLALYYVAGGLELIIRGLHSSMRAIPLDGSISPHEGLVDLAVSLSARLLFAGVEVAMPAVAALFLVEVVMGVAARFAPQANVFLLGLPLKVLAALTTVSAVILLFPEAISGVTEVVGTTFLDAIDGLRNG